MTKGKHQAWADCTTFQTAAAMAGAALHLKNDHHVYVLMTCKQYF